MVPMYKKIDLFYVFLHLPFDIVAVSLAFIVSYWLRGNGLEIYRLPYHDYLQLLYRTVPLWIIVFMLQGLYTKRYLFGTLQNLSHVAVSVLAGWASFVVFLVFLKNEQTLVFPRLMLIYILILGFLFVFGGRLILRFIQFLVRSAGIGKKRIMVVGQGKQADALELHFLQGRDLGSVLVKRLDLLAPEDAAKEFRRYRVDEVILADPNLSDNQVLEYLRVAQNSGASCHLVPNMFEVQASNVLFTTMAGMPLLTFRQTPLEGWGRIVKRLIDIVVAILGLLVASPLFLLIAILVKVTDPGPALYGHGRISRGGKKVKIYKFRTMLQKYCTGPGYSGKSPLDIFEEMGRSDLIEEFKRDQKVKDDPRVSKLGKFLRKSSLDELPQLWNVLRGDLSLVGPRPIVDEELQRYGRWGSYLLSIKPGLTGLWQVSGRNDVSYDERVRLDAHYVQNWSLWQDAIIVIKTFLTILKGRNGY